MSRSTIRFYLNDDLLELDDIAPDVTLLDYLRLRAMLRGTKEGCAEGDCGACSVLVGRVRPAPASGEPVLAYETVNSCIRFVGSLDGCHVVTVDSLHRPGGPLHPAQQAIVAQHGSQCGFCTPGFVMSLYSMWINGENGERSDVLRNLQGNLCRCTGYRPLVDAALSMNEYGAPAEDPLVARAPAMLARLQALRDGQRVHVEHDGGALFLPADVNDLASILSEHPNATIVAGATDVGLWVTKLMREISPVVFIGQLDELSRIEVLPHEVVLGATVTYSDARPTIEAHFPALVEVWDLIGGQQVRNMGTIGGNIANGSPIGDTPPALIALGAYIVLRRGDARRTVKLEDYFITYGKQDRLAGEFVESVHIPRPAPENRIAVYKVSKRREEDITSTLGAFNLALNGGVVRDITIAYGGMAGTPARARNVEDALRGQPWTLETVERAMALYEQDFQPLTDWRATASYRMTAARNLLKRFYLASTDVPEIRL